MYICARCDELSYPVFLQVFYRRTNTRAFRRHTTIPLQCCLHETTLLRITWNNTDSRVYDDANTDDASDADATDDDTLKMVLNCNARDLSDNSAKRHRSYQSSANRILIIVRYNHLKSPSFSFIDSNIRQSIVSVSVRSVRFDSHCIQTA